MQRIVIVGGGFSGTLLAVHLLRAAGRGQSVHLTLIEQEPRRLGRGYAYSTAHAACLLNVPAGRMSAFEEDPESFIRFAAERDPQVTGASFVPRGMYGQYLGSLLAAARSAAANAHFEQISAEAVAIDDPPSPGSVSVVLDDERVLAADRIALALGNFPPRDPAGADAHFLGSARYTRNPWAPDALAKVSTDGPVLMLGTGLTMLDVALVMHERAPDATLYAVSRRGLLPQPHRAATSPPPALPFPESMRMEHPTPVKLLRALRREIQMQSAHGLDWREVVTALRNDTPALWQALEERHRRQFLRHLQPFWETHRHRAAPQTASRIQALRDSKRLTVLAARIERIELGGNGGRVTLRGRGGGGAVQTLEVGHVINCTGPDTNLTATRGRLFQSAISRGLLVPDGLGLGLEVAPDGSVIHADGTISRRVYVIGPLRKAQLWETTAVPELRLQAADLAGRLA